MSNDNMEPSNASIDAMPQWLRAMLELQQQIADMHATQQLQYEEIQRLIHAIPTSTESNTKAPKERLGAPAYFDASDLTLYSSWRMEMLAKLSVDGDAIGSLTNQGWYINGRLKDRAKQKFHPWMEACEPALRTPDNIMKHLDVLFQDTAMQQKALDWLQSARQRNTPLTTFIPDFNTKILEAGGQSWEDRMKISMLKKALTFKLLQALVSVDEDQTYEGFCTQLRTLDDRLTKLKSIQNSGRRHYIPATHTPALKNNNNDADAMAWVDSNVYAQARVSAVRTGFQVPGITPEEVADRRHIASNCRSTYVPPYSRERSVPPRLKDGSAPVRANHVTLEEDSEDNYEDAPELEEVAINGRDAVSTGVSPFFLTHGYHMEVLDLLETTQFTPDPRSPIQIADNIVTKLRDARDWAEASMATAKQDQEDRTNVHRDPAEQYKIGDLVWLNLKNIRTTRPSRTLDYRHARYKVIEVLGSHNYRLDTPPGIHDVFHTSLLCRAATDPFPSQLTSNWQPPGIIGEDNELEWEIEDILDERPRGRGRQYLVKWVGYDQPTWTPSSVLSETAALDRWELLLEGGG
ncbi:hypothetical protein BDDG_12700 [Blastomyces dermatitidis ATCC 18188]|uniref:Chromo domain-containing protein n=1 Tax=Ajellomyces dermatitidis (strain ATCC 18188 / CBS 674.68) TaxID=653446 RepID=A0A0J9EQH3_AJEDA|nr:hypothetical protein BDDG_12700 [Blastomyces dermatitidis ATCC 18188]